MIETSAVLGVLKDVQNTAAVLDKQIKEIETAIAENRANFEKKAKGLSDQLTALIARRNACAGGIEVAKAVIAKQLPGESVNEAVPENVVSLDKKGNGRNGS
jgi:hypothetical protein